jgi:hypothetical protein
MRIFFDEELQVSRLVSDVYNKTEEYQSVSNILGSIRPIKAEDAFLSDGIPYETFKLYCNIDEDIKDGDKITYSYQDYIVKNIRRYNLKDIERIEGLITIIKQ